MEHRGSPLLESPRAAERAGLRIAVISATGTGSTLLSSFDDALQKCGVHDYNLIPLSSVIPPASAVVCCDHYEAPEREYGHRLYLVKAEMRSDEEGTAIAAGLGWLQWGDGRGIFVEHELQGRGQSPTEIEATLERQITTSLSGGGVPFAAEEAHMRVVSTVIGARPACALVVAVYQAAGWTS